MVSIYVALQQFLIQFRKWKSNIKTKTNPSLITNVFPCFKEVAWFYFEVYWLLLLLTFVPIDSCEYFGLSFSRVRFRVSCLFYNQSKTSLSKINCDSDILSLSKLKKRRNPRQPNRVQYNLNPFLIFFHMSCYFLQGLLNLKNYDDRLYVNVDDLAVWASDLSYRKGWIIFYFPDIFYV